MTAVETPARAVRRAPIVVLVILAIAAAVAAGASQAPDVARPVTPIEATQLPAKSALSTAWYCPGVPPVFPLANQTYTLSNLGEKAARAAVTVHPDDGSDPISRTVTVPHASVRTFERSELPNGSMVVEPFSPDVIVSAGLESDNRLATVPCANNAGRDWYFAGGTTIRGMAQWLVLENPFAADARVDVTLRTDSGTQLLPSLSGLDVAGRSRVIVAIHNEAVRRDRVSVQVHAELGRIVAAQTLRYGAATGPPGVATSIGAVKPATDWWFAGGDTRAGASEIVAIANVGQLDAQVNVQAQAGTETIVHPVELTVPAGGVSWVQVGECADDAPACVDVPSRSGYVLLVQTDTETPIIAQTLSRFDGDRDSTLGAASSVGSTDPAEQWVVARTRAIEHRSTSIALADPGVQTAHVNVAIVYGGHVDRPDALQRLEVSPGERLVLPLADLRPLQRVDAAVIITSDVPIFVESTIYAENDATRAPGVPAR
jgi:hypothetical protein